MRIWPATLVLGVGALCAGAAPVIELPWSFHPLAEQPVPQTRQAGWTKTRIDDFILSGLEAKSLKPAVPADDRVLLRRLYFDLIGLPPSPDQLAVFRERLAVDRPQALAHEIESLLASPHYGERWARHWLDLARYTDKTASWLKSTASAWRYRDWVVQALNRDLPYNQFVKLQLANDLLPGSDPSDNAALGFLGLSPTYWKELQLPPEVIKTTVADEWEERMDAVGRTFLGLTFGCARCHDHKFEPITQADYYAIAGVFASVRIADRPLLEEKLWAPVAKARAEVARLEKRMEEVKKNPGALKLTAGVKPPAFSENYSAKIEKLQPARYSPLNAKPELLSLKKGVRITKDRYATFTAGRLRGELQSLGRNYSVAFWFRNDLDNKARPVTGYFFSRGPQGVAQAPGDHLGVAGTAGKTPGTLFLFNGNVAKAVVAGKTVLAPGTWNHVVLVRRGDRVAGWLNGAARAEFEGEIKATAADSGEFFLGGRNEGFALVKGRMAHFALFDRALEPGEVRALHTASGLPRSSITEPLEENTPAPSGRGEQLKELEQQIAAIKERTPHYNVPMVNAVSEAALFVKPAEKFGTKLDYQEGRARDLTVHKGGDPNRTGDLVPRRFLSAFPVSDGTLRRFERGSGRLDLAEALVEEAGPLAARVIVNRVWHHHFGRGIAPTPSELGHSGEAPTHPKLLDDLAARFVKNGWSLKWLHREILQSATWQQSNHNSAAQEVDPGNELVARMSRRRLEIETWRDSMLAVSGDLDARVGGEPQDLNARENLRRTLYGQIQRRELNQFLRLHDFPDPTAHAPTRPRTITPLQQLFTLNGPFIQWQAEALATNLMKEKGTEARVVAAYGRLFQRAPRASELQLAATFLAGHEDDAATWAQYAHALLASNEFQFIN